MSQETPNAPDKPTPPAPPASKKASPVVPGGWIALALLAFVAGMLLLYDPTPKLITYTEFRKLAETGQIKKFTLVGKDRARGEVRNPESDALKPLKLQGGEFSVMLPASDNQNEFIRNLEAKDREYREALKKEKPDDKTEEIAIAKVEEPIPVLTPILTLILPLVLVAAFFVFFIPHLVRRCCGHGRGETRTARDRRLPAKPGQVLPPRGTGAERRAARRVAGDGEDVAGESRRRGSERPVLQHQRLRIHPDVRRRRG
jgi:hypothetical protein